MSCQAPAELRPGGGAAAAASQQCALAAVLHGVVAVPHGSVAGWQLTR